MLFASTKKASYKHILAKLAPILVAGGLLVLIWASYSKMMTIGLLIKGIIAGLVGAFAMSVAMMIVQKMGKMQLMIPKLVSSNIGLERIWMAIYFGTGICFALGYIIIAKLLAFSLSKLGQPRSPYWDQNCP